MVIDRVTSLADLAFRGKTNKRYRHLAVLTAAYYGKPDLSWEKAMAFLHEVAHTQDGGSCANIVRDVNYNRELVKDDWQEPPEQLELTPQPQPKKKVISYSDWLYDERDSWGNQGYRNNHDNYYYTTNT